MGVGKQKHSHQDTAKDLKIALVCDWLTTPGGAEKVLLELHKMYPDAPIYTSQYRKRGINWFDDVEVRTGWLQIFPAGLRRVLGPLRQLYFSHLDLSTYDLVISVTGAEAKAVRTHNHKLTQQAYHLCYCHVPTQYYWQMYDKYLQNPGFGFLNPLVRLCFKTLVKPLRKADYHAAQRPDQFVTISSYAQAQIQQYYHREAQIVPPPVEIEKFLPKKIVTSRKARQHKENSKTTEFSTGKLQVFHKFSTSFPQDSVDFSTGSTGVEPYFIIACRQVTWKRVDLAIQACRNLHLPLKVVGDGPEHRNLVKLAQNAAEISFVPWVESGELAQLLQQAKGYIFPSLEPFGIAAVEALAAGCPVIAYHDGGSRDFIQEGQNGVLFDQQTVASLEQALQKFQPEQFDRSKVSQSAQKFAAGKFRKGIKKLIAARRKERKA